MDTFPEITDHIERIGFFLERFDFDKHNDEGNPDAVLKARRALDDLEGAVADLVP